MVATNDSYENVWLCVWPQLSEQIGLVSRVTSHQYDDLARKSTMRLCRARWPLLLVSQSDILYDGHHK